MLYLYLRLTIFRHPIRILIVTKPKSISLIAEIILKMSMRRFIIFNSLVALTVSVAGKAIASDDDYLKMLEGEAQDLVLDQKGQLQEDNADKVTSKKTTGVRDAFSWQGSLQGDNLPKGLKREEFESVLQDNFYGTFLFFKKLNSADKQTVYYRYTKAESTNLENVRKNILDLLKR